MGWESPNLPRHYPNPAYQIYETDAQLLAGKPGARRTALWRKSTVSTLGRICLDCISWDAGWKEALLLPSNTVFMQQSPGLGGKRRKKTKTCFWRLPGSRMRGGSRSLGASPPLPSRPCDPWIPGLLADVGNRPGGSQTAPSPTLITALLCCAIVFTAVQLLLHGRRTDRQTPNHGE